MTNEPQAVELLKPEEAAKVLAIGRTKVYDLLARGELPRVKVGASVRVPRHALMDWIKSNTEEPRG
jgi:excisionase family DNA binding protein